MVEACENALTNSVPDSVALHPGSGFVVLQHVPSDLL